MRSIVGIAAMATNCPSRSGLSGSVPRYILWAAAAIALYILSLGPAESLAVRGLIFGEIRHYAYLPLPQSLKQHYLRMWSRVDPQCAEPDLLPPAPTHLP